MGAELDEPVAAWGLTGHQRGQLEALLGQLESDDRAPTSVRERPEAARVHVADSLAALGLEVVRAAASVADVGSGAGFPGLALAVALPDSQLTLIESQRGKCEYLHRACRAADVRNAEIVCARAEEWSEGIAANDVVLARALAPQAVVLEYAAPLLRPGGALVDWRGKRSAEDEHAADEAAETLGMRRDAVHGVVPFDGARDRNLHVFLKVRDTPERFPRRPGMARKRPLAR